MISNTSVSVFCPVRLRTRLIRSPWTSVCPIPLPSGHYPRLPSPPRGASTFTCLLLSRPRRGGEGTAGLPSPLGQRGGAPPLRVSRRTRSGTCLGSSGRRPPLSASSARPGPLSPPACGLEPFLRRSMTPYPTTGGSRLSRSSVLFFSLFSSMNSFHFPLWALKIYFSLHHPLLRMLVLVLNGGSI